MTLEQEIAAFEARLGAAVENAMENEMFDIGRSGILAVLPERVYGMYDPVSYERRETEGGLLDYRNIQLVGKKYDRASGRYEIEIRDMAHGNENQIGEGYDPGPIDQIIESGEGYHWKYSDIYRYSTPRPFYEPAEKFLSDGGYLDSALQRGLAKFGQL